MPCDQGIPLLGRESKEMVSFVHKSAAVTGLFILRAEQDRPGHRPHRGLLLDGKETHNNHINKLIGKIILESSYCLA